MKNLIGVDIGGTKIAIVKGNENGEILEKIRFENDLTPQKAIEKILVSVEKMGSADAIGISCGGPLDAKKGLILSPPNLPGWDEIPIVSLLENATGIPTFLQNDADACALAEWKHGAGRGCDSMIFLTFGTGMGAGLILDGKLYAGSSGAAGEVGHIAMEKDGPVGYGKHGSFEGFCSGGGIRQIAIAKAAAQFAKGSVPSFCENPNMLDSITAKAVADCANEGKADAIEIYKECGYTLGRGIAILIDLLNPQRIVIGSIYARSQALLESSMTEALKKEALPASLANCRILPAALGEALGDIAALSVAQNGLERRIGS
ncbi:MAG: ROK family protein [Ruminococcaceae bacterium]|nr:ROK family protein [Oscillospiraceae bacterium]